MERAGFYSHDWVERLLGGARYVEGRHSATRIHFAVVRIPGGELIARAVDFFISDPLHHYMESGMLRGIKERAEGRRRRRWMTCSRSLIRSRELSRMQQVTP
jgi:hypothetical protein